MDNVLLKEILGKIVYGTKLEIIEVDRLHLRDKSMDESRYITDSFNDDNFRDIYKNYYNYYVSLLTADSWLKIYICKSEDE